MASEDQHQMDRTEDAVISEEVPEASPPKKKTWQFFIPATDPWEEAAKEYYDHENTRKEDGSWGTWTEEQISLIKKGFENAMSEFVIFDGEERIDVPVYDSPDEDAVTDEDQDATVVDPEDATVDDQQMKDEEVHAGPDDAPEKVAVEDPSLPSSIQN